MAKRKSDYLTDNEIFEIECAIYNNITETLYESTTEVSNKFDKSFIEQALFKGEEYCRLSYKYVPGDYDHIVLTSRGRVINTHSKRMLKIVITVTQLHSRVAGNKIPVEEIFDDMGWKYDLGSIRKDYIKNNWRCKILPY